MGMIPVDEMRWDNPREPLDLVSEHRINPAPTISDMRIGQIRVYKNCQKEPKEEWNFPVSPAYIRGG
jgi:hypothetical protein